ncbi:uncharacterized protein KY384_003376 [Bacidia gigantensis]|uniref:uncharacterized protein n=1 Tax=Bacidia gigantensis TaxID=2732470 RepID=UPI001D054265|nr:uncharacterized protein KY384_003376 [Bacidia gigantensis]KAG8531744.1 hypothetical protein KY384_003376 [Bacidia gigantensis]
MRLLQTTDITLHNFYDDDIPPYAILSHTWGKVEEEVSLHDSRDVAVMTRPGFYVWIDTCCIDKTSSAELSEAINSMYEWYKNAQVCYAYLSDVTTAQGREISAFDSTPSKIVLFQSKWFERGWTLQELLAPSEIEFYDQAWGKIGTRSRLQRLISTATGISFPHLKDPNSACVAVKLSWAAHRKTTRVEDMAYCLLGLLDVNIPLIYGEGPRAFTRLQQEIIRNSSDESVFAWTDPEIQYSGMLARSPAAFALSGGVVEATFEHSDRPPYTITNKGLAIQTFQKEHDPQYFSDSNRCVQLLHLQCAAWRGEAEMSYIQLKLTRKTRNEWVRSGAWISRPAPVSRTPIVASERAVPERVTYIDAVYRLDAVAGLQNTASNVKKSVFIINRFTAGIRKKTFPVLREKFCLDGEAAVSERRIQVTAHGPLFAALLLQWQEDLLYTLIIKSHENDAQIRVISMDGKSPNLLTQSVLDTFIDEHRIGRCCFADSGPKSQFTWRRGMGLQADLNYLSGRIIAVPGFELTLYDISLAPTSLQSWLLKHIDGK